MSDHRGPLTSSMFTSSFFAHSSFKYSSKCGGHRLAASMRPCNSKQQQQRRRDPVSLQQRALTCRGQGCKPRSFPNCTHSDACIVRTSSSRTSLPAQSDVHGRGTIFPFCNRSDFVWPMWVLIPTTLSSRCTSCTSSHSSSHSVRARFASTTFFARYAAVPTSAGLSKSAAPIIAASCCFPRAFGTCVAFSPISSASDSSVPVTIGAHPGFRSLRAPWLGADSHRS